MAPRRVCRLAIIVIVLAASLVLAIPLSVPGYACACGAAVAPGGANATMNREVALVHWDGTTETLLMQLAMNATTDNVALVVPTPVIVIVPAVLTAENHADLRNMEAASSDIARSWKETLRESRASLSAARQEWREAARLLAGTPEQT